MALAGAGAEDMARAAADGATMVQEAAAVPEEAAARRTGPAAATRGHQRRVREETSSRALADGDAAYSSWDTDYGYQKFIQKMNPQRVAIDHTSRPNATVIRSIGPDSCFLPSRRRAIGAFLYTLIELTGTDRPGLLSEVSAVLTNLECNVANSELWTQNERAAAVMQVTDTKSGLAILDAERKKIKLFPEHDQIYG
ncbi:ACT domain-containing protein ACR4-like [Miscanthus floridulus]|uniref:ACT domain-containing protein ACR4-like n=1 Tax=Miscanthus floridulus TaxID=154761 RepID=UPI00345A9BF4